LNLRLKSSTRRTCSAKLIEIKKLSQDFVFGDRWGPAIIAVIGGVIGGLLSGALAAYATDLWARRNALAAVNAAREKQAADLDQATHEKRLESYQGLWKHTSPFAIYFPEWTPPWGRPDRHKREQIGQAISRWYFESGLLLSAEARDAYFRLAHV
jgi:hypothetical protein